MSWATNRKAPYIESTIRQQPCIRCGKPSSFQWSICADENRYRPICLDCDVKLNRLILLWMKHPCANLTADLYENEKRKDAE